MMLLPVVTDSQQTITCRQTNPESCRPGNDGAAIVNIPSSLASYTSVEWTTPGGQHISGNQITGQKAGAYSVVVKATPCNKPIFQDVVIIEREAA